MYEADSELGSMVGVTVMMEGRKDGDGARVGRKEKKDRTQSNQQQLNA